MAVACCYTASTPSSFECRSDPDSSFSGAGDSFSGDQFPGKFQSLLRSPATSIRSSLIFRFPPNLKRQLSVKAMRNCGNIGVAQIAAASWTNALYSPLSLSPPLRRTFHGSATPTPVSTPSQPPIAGENCNGSAQLVEESNVLDSGGSIAVHAGERFGRGIVTDAITTPVVNTSAYFFKKTSELIDFKEGRHKSFEYGRYGNPTTEVLEDKISALEGAEASIIFASGMCASAVMFLSLVPAGGRILTTTDCYRKTRIFIETVLPKMGIKATVIDPADMKALKSALEKGDVTLFFTECPTNPFLRCVDIPMVSDLCHRNGSLVCIDGTFATPLNQKPLALGADIVIHSLTKYIAGHNDVLGGCISGSEKLLAQIRITHHVFGGAINPNAAYLIIRGMKTMHLRIQQQNSTALRMARLLEAHPKVNRVYYPGLPTHPEYLLAKRQMLGFGGVVSFEIKGDLKSASRFCDSLKIPYIAPSFGGCESIVDQPAIMSYWDLSQEERGKYGIKDNLVRFSFGVEDFEDLKSDVLQALNSV